MSGVSISTGRGALGALTCFNTSSGLVGHSSAVAKGAFGHNSADARNGRRSPSNRRLAAGSLPRSLLPDGTMTAAVRTRHARRLGSR